MNGVEVGGGGPASRLLEGEEVLMDNRSVNYLPETLDRCGHWGSQAENVSGYWGLTQRRREDGEGPRQGLAEFPGNRVGCCNEG